MSNPCESLGEDLALQVLGELDPAAAAAVDRHLAGCAACRLEQQKLQQTMSLLGPVPDHQLTELETARLEARVYRQLARENARPARRPWGRSLIRAAAVLALVSLGFWGRSLVPWAADQPDSTTGPEPTIVKLENLPGSRSGYRFTPQGLHLIARGKDGMKP